MFSNGDVVIFTLDGSRGIVLRENDGHYQVIWEDSFVSWESIDLLTIDDELTKKQRMYTKKNLYTHV
jgi:hypothetical protein